MRTADASTTIRAYFEWLISFIETGEYSWDDYRCVLSQLYSTEFKYHIPNDGNRAADGISLRQGFIDYNPGSEDYIQGPCNVLEMMVALSVRCENDIMEESSDGFNAGKWFAVMMTSMHLDDQDDSHYDDQYVEGIIFAMLEREYGPDGDGSLFLFKSERNVKKDARTMEIWSQMCAYLNEYLGYV